MAWLDAVCIPIFIGEVVLIRGWGIRGTVGCFASAGTGMAWFLPTRSIAFCSRVSIVVWSIFWRNFDSSCFLTIPFAISLSAGFMHSRWVWHSARRSPRCFLAMSVSSVSVLSKTALRASVSSGVGSGRRMLSFRASRARCIEAGACSQFPSWCWSCMVR